MRKALILTFIILALSLAGVFYGAFQIYQTSDQVVYTENTIYGDKTAANGLVFHMNTHYDHKLTWDIESSINEGVKTSSNYKYHLNRVTGPYRLDTSVSFDTFIDSYYEPDKENTGVDLAFEELAATIEPDESGTKTILLKDYIDYYPLQIFVNLKGHYINYAIDSYFSETDYLTDDTKHIREITASFREYFKIPVLEHQTLELSLEKESDGTIFHYGTSSTDSEQYYSLTYSQYIDDGFYFVLDAHGTDGTLVDLSELPDGFGIFYLPVENGEVCPDKLEMVYELDPNMYIEAFYKNEAQDQLFLFTNENGSIYLNTISLPTMELYQRLKLHESLVENDYAIFYYEEDYILVQLSEKLIVFSSDSNRKFQFDFICDVIPDGSDFYSFYPEAICYNGERLAIAHTISRTDHHSTDIDIRIYDKTGLLYCGEYASSLTTGNVADLNYYDYYCHAFGEDALHIRWE